MNSTIENTEKSPPPAIEPRVIWSDGELVRVSNSRVFLYPPDVRGTKNKFGSSGEKLYFLKDGAERVFGNELAREGMPAAMIMLYVEMMWKAGIDLSWGVPTSHLARELGRAKNSITNALAEFRRRHLIRIKEPREYPTKWEFLEYDHFIARVREQYGNRLKRSSCDLLPKTDWQSTSKV